ncbi:MAG: hypothetical protein ACKVP0_26235 [Pirellulaceae bacterium]
MERLPENLRLELQLTAAKLVLGLLYSWEIPPVADRALLNGEYSPAFAELAAIDNPIMSEVEPVLIKAIAELGLRLPSRPDAAWLIVRNCMQLIVLNAESLRTALSLLKETSYAVRDVMPDSQYVGDNLDLGSLIGIYWSYTAPNENCYEGRLIIDESERQTILDALARNEARAWLGRHAETTVENGLANG